MSDQERIEAATDWLLRACRESHITVTGDQRISEVAAAGLLGLSAGGLKNLRSEGDGPPAYRVGVDGCRISYRLIDLAVWLESRKC